MRNLGDNFIRRAFIKAKSKLIASAFDSINNAELGIFSLIFHASFKLTVFFLFWLTAYSPRLLFVNRKNIRKVWTSSKNQNETIIVDGLDDAIAVDFHYTKGFIFWTDVTLEKIKRIRVSTGEIEDVVSVGLEKP